MSLIKLPELDAGPRPGGAEFTPRPDALERWEPQMRATEQDDAPTITMYGPIGRGWDGEGVTDQRIAAALRAIGKRDVVVNINSPGGDVFTGTAIYNMLREHPARVTVRVMSVAASIASVIAMAGDDILMGEGASYMIHNASAVVFGNRHDLAEASEWLAPFDEAMAQIYAARTGLSVAEIAAMMDKETWVRARQAVDEGWATGMLDSAHIVDGGPDAAGQRKALATVEAALASAGHTRAQRRAALQNLFSGKPSAAAPDAMPSAGDANAAALQSLIQTIKGA